MLAVLSPAKTLDYDTPLPTERYTEPRFLDDAETLIATLKDYEEEDLQRLMKISEKLAVLNAGRYQTWQRPFTVANSRPAIFAFKGDVYRDIEAYDYSDAELDYLQAHVRILSGLYGVLRPLDLMQPYRLEMGTKLENDKGTNLYQFWGAKIAENLNQALDEQGDEILVNLASNEYFDAVDTSSFKGRIVKCDFLDQKKGKYKIVSFYAKRARGHMTNFMVRNQCKTVEDLKAFDVDGYYFSEERSTPDNLVFLRDER